MRLARRFGLKKRLTKKAALSEKAAGGLGDARF
jgi:hypothetical protein